MIDNVANTALLPAGLRDLLPPEARQEAEIIHAMMTCFESFGYERIKPPLVEFDESLLNGIGENCAPDSLRMMDPDSRRMMGLRSDITVQAARVAMTRLVNAPRPLRLSYCGEVLRARGDQLRPERQFCQVGIELIGSDSVAADVEMVTVAVLALRDIGVSGLTVDLQMPTLIAALVEEFSLSQEESLSIIQALDRKDIAAIPDMSELSCQLLESLLACVGPVNQTLPVIKALSLPGKAAREAQHLVAVAEKLGAHLPDLSLSLDPIEQLSLGYHTGLTFSFYSSHSPRGALGLGGRYMTGVQPGQVSQSATGVTLFLDMLLRVTPPCSHGSRVYLPCAASLSEGLKLRDEGYVVIRQIDDGVDRVEEANRLKCDFLYQEGKLVALSPKEEDTESRQKVDARERNI